MKIEIGNQRPESFKENWPGQYDFFSHLEYVCAIPHVLFLITTRKADGTPNANFHSWSSFSGDSGGFFAVMPGVGTHSHTYRNVLREKEFCVNFISPDYYDACMRTVENNGADTDEIAAGGFTAESAVTVQAPRIREAFLTLECSLHSVTDLSGRDILAMIVGRVNHVAVRDGSHSIDRICSRDGFMFNVHSPKHPVTGEGQLSALAVLNPVRLIEG